MRVVVFVVDEEDEVVLVVSYALFENLFQAIQNNRTNGLRRTQCDSKILQRTQHVLDEILNLDLRNALVKTNNPVVQTVRSM